MLQLFGLAYAANDNTEYASCAWRLRGRVHAPRTHTPDGQARRVRAASVAGHVVQLAEVLDAQSLLQRRRGCQAEIIRPSDL